MVWMINGSIYNAVEIHTCSYLSGEGGCGQRLAIIKQTITSKQKQQQNNPPLPTPQHTHTHTQTQQPHTQPPQKKPNNNKK